MNNLESALLKTKCVSVKNVYIVEKLYQSRESRGKSQREEMQLWSQEPQPPTVMPQKRDVVVEVSWHRRMERLLSKATQTSTKMFLIKRLLEAEVSGKSFQVERAGSRHQRTVRRKVRAQEITAMQFRFKLLGVPRRRHSTKGNLKRLPCYISSANRTSNQTLLIPFVQHQQRKDSSEHRHHFWVRRESINRSFLWTSCATSQPLLKN